MLIYSWFMGSFPALESPLDCSCLMLTHQAITYRVDTPMLDYWSHSTRNNRIVLCTRFRFLHKDREQRHVSQEKLRRTDTSQRQRQRQSRTSDDHHVIGSQERRNPTACRCRDTYTGSSSYHIHILPSQGPCPPPCSTVVKGLSSLWILAAMSISSSYTHDLCFTQSVYHCNHNNIRQEYLQTKGNLTLKLYKKKRKTWHASSIFERKGAWRVTHWRRAEVACATLRLDIFNGTRLYSM